MISTVVIPAFVWPIVLAAMVALDASYCGMETGLYRLNKIRLDLQADRGRASAIILRRLIARFDHVLATVLIGTNFARYAITFIVSSMLLTAGFSGDIEWITTIIVTPTLFVLGDSVPKNVFQRHAERLVHPFARLVSVSTWLFRACGVTYLVCGFSVGMLRLFGSARSAAYNLGHRGVEAIVAEGRASGLLTDYQSVMADRVMRLADLRLSDIARPLTEAVTAPVTVSRDDFLAEITRRSHSNIPLLDPDGKVVGMLDVFDFLTSPVDARPGELAGPPLVLPAATGLTAALPVMQHSGQTLAVIADAHGRHIGVVSTKDIAGQIVGELSASGD